MSSAIHQRKPPSQPFPGSHELFEQDLKDWVHACAGCHGSADGRDWMVRMSYMRAFGSLMTVKDIIQAAERIRRHALNRSHISEGEAALLEAKFIRHFRKTYLRYWQGIVE